MPYLDSENSPLVVERELRRPYDDAAGIQLIVWNPSFKGCTTLALETSV